MNAKRLLFLCMCVSFVVGGVGAWVAGGILPSLWARLKVPDSVEPKAAEQIVNLMEEEHATISVVARVTPAVVSVIARTTRPQTMQISDTSSGTGFFVTEDGLVLTNRHVVDFPNVHLFVVMNRGEEYPATLVDIDPILDIAVLRVEGSGFPTVTLGDSDHIQIGQTVIAIGNTLSEFHNTVTKGVISGMNRHVTAGISFHASETIEKAIQTDAAINPGNSGGPLINLLGEVIGMNTAVSIDGEAIAFAIPINQTKRALEDVKQTGHIVRPWLGIQYVLIESGEIENSTDVPVDVGARLVGANIPSQAAVAKNSPADRAGLKEGDVLIAVDGEFFTHDRAIAEMIAPHRPGDVVKLTWLRNGRIFESSVTLVDVSVRGK